MAVQEYRADIENAQNAQQKQEALDGLVGAMMARTQKAWLQSHPAADLNEAARNMKKALLSYGQGNATVQEALENAGLSVPQPGSHTMRVMSYIGQQAAMLEEQAKAEENQKQYSIEQYEKNGKVLSYVKADRQVIAGNDPQEWGEQITKYINEEIRHKKDVTVYTENGVPLTITEDAAGKAAYWNENREGDPVSAEEYGLKLRMKRTLTRRRRYHVEVVQRNVI